MCSYTEIALSPTNLTTGRLKELSCACKCAWACVHCREQTPNSDMNQSFGPFMKGGHRNKERRSDTEASSLPHK